MSTIQISQQFKNETMLHNEAYENAHFVACQFNTLSGIRFTDCIFEACDLSNCKLEETAFQNIEFKDCKLLGLHFDTCTPFLFETFFKNCILNHSSFVSMKIKKLQFNNCQLTDIDFSGAELPNSSFENCNLLNAKFDNCQLNNADFSTAINYIIHPENNRLKKAKFSRMGIDGLLLAYDIEITN